MDVCLISHLVITLILLSVCLETRLTENSTFLDESKLPGSLFVLTLNREQ